ncbi:MAG: prolyl-tRNA synthetase associated domain-containing protein [Clostridia bacterium]|nr:prolyl-tRNA synthetase associated domain-containing protein [Clostridia bacterium]
MPDLLSTKAADVCDYLKNLGIEFSRVTHEAAETLEKCAEIEKIIGGKICKNLFLQTTTGSAYYLLMMDSGKKFVTKEVSKALGSSRLSFASGEKMESMLGTSPGSLSITSLIFDSDKKVMLAIDEDILKEEFICCHPCDCTATLKIKTADITGILIPSLGLTPKIIDIKEGML